jgi:uncharacterized protein involved in type VI secretion and phage assembly
MVGGAEIHVNGSLLDPALGQRVSEVRVQDNLMLATSFLIRLSDAEMANVDTHPFVVGADVEILMAAPGSSTPTSLVKGKVASVEAEFDHGGVVISALGYDQSIALMRAPVSQTYQDMTADDIARKIASRNGLSAGTIDNAGAASPHEFQHNETDWAFLWRLAQRIDFEVSVADQQLNFRRAAPGASPVSLRYGDTLQVFRPRVTGVQQVSTVSVRAWDPSAKQVMQSSAQAPSQLDTSIGISRSDASSALGGGTVAIGDRPVLQQDEADALAQSVAARLANGFAEAEGTCVGDPRVRAGAAIQVDGVGSRFGGTYTITSSTHLLRGQRGYHTHFVISGRAPRHLLDLMTPAPPRTWGGSLVVGTVTQNDDPDGLGRIRVKHPDLGDSIEGWWARIATLNAGSERGVLMLPQVGDEVVVGFEHGDVRKPYVLGSVWNGSDKPGDDLTKTDGSFGLRSDAEIVANAKGQITLTTNKDLSIQTDGKIGEKANGDYQVEGQTVSIKANGSVTVEATGDLTLKGATVSVQAQGTVTVSGAQISLG